MDLLREFGSAVWEAAAAAVLTLLAISPFVEKTARPVAKISAVVVGLSVWFAAQMYREFTGQSLEDVVRHYLAFAVCQTFGFCKSLSKQALTEPPSSTTRVPIPWLERPRSSPMPFIKPPNVDPSTQSAAASWVERGWQDHERQDNDLAIADFNEAIRLDPKNVEAYFARGVVYSTKETSTAQLPIFLK